MLKVFLFVYLTQVNGPVALPLAPEHPTAHTTASLEQEENKRKQPRDTCQYTNQPPKQDSMSDVEGIAVSLYFRLLPSISPAQLRRTAVVQC